MIEVIGVENLDGIFMDILFQVDCKCEHCVRKMQELGMDTESKSGTDAVRRAYAG